MSRVVLSLQCRGLPPSSSCYISSALIWVKNCCRVIIPRHHAEHVQPGPLRPRLREEPTAKTRKRSYAISAWRTALGYQQGCLNRVLRMVRQGMTSDRSTVRTGFTIISDRWRSLGIVSERCTICQHLFILPISSTGYTMAVESSPAGPTALVPLGDPD